MELLETGKCGIHTVHCAFKHGDVASRWGTDKVLSVMYKIFHQSPSTRADYERWTDGVYPLQFCSHQHAKDEKVAVRTIDVLENIQIVVNFWITYQNQSNLLGKIKAIFV